ncbi:outer membrane lipid asymmetry maintenance protein MlaD [Serratia sp. NPDC078593]|uniref:outer membrane lipid asymmetry maintenance protein MlaD n=1 Tax=unclassified Serratia (in: enterobacteria) TaxID=2647522 RepID=UPI0037CFAAB6
MQTKKSEIWVGAFMLIALCAIIFICLQVANVKSIGSEPTYRIYATFDNIGGLKARSPVRIGGVVVGRVADIALDPKTYTPRVALDIQEKFNHIPDTSSLAIRTSGLLGEQYLALNVGFEDPEMGTSILKEGGTIQDTKSAMVLEDLIGQFLYKSGSQDSAAKPEDAAPAAGEAP